MNNDIDYSFWVLVFSLIGVLIYIYFVIIKEMSGYEPKKEDDVNLKDKNNKFI